VPLFLEDFAPGQIRESAPRTLTKEEIIAFARDYDPQPFHVDEADPERIVEPDEALARLG